MLCIVLYFNLLISLQMEYFGSSSFSNIYCLAKSLVVAKAEYPKNNIHICPSDAVYIYIYIYIYINTHISIGWKILKWKTGAY